MKTSNKKGKKDKHAKALKYAEDWVPIKSITNGMIFLDKKNEKVTGVKIRPRNIFILDQDSQYQVLSALRNFYDTLDYEFWLICADRPVDISLYVSRLQLLYNQTQNTNIRKLILQDINKANMFIANKVVDTEYYLLFKSSDDEIIQKRLRQMMGGLAGAGLTSAQTTNDDLRIILDNFLNGGSTTEFGTVMVK